MLLFVVSRDQLVVQEEYDEIYEDIKEYMGKYGKVLKLVIPQPKDDEPDCPGMGHAFIEYTAVSSAQLARRVDYMLHSGSLEESVQLSQNRSLLL